MVTHKYYVGVVNSGGERAMINWKGHRLKCQETTEILALDLIE